MNLAQVLRPLSTLIVLVGFGASSHGWVEPGMRGWAQRLGIDPELSYSATRTVANADGTMRMREYRGPQGMRLEMQAAGQKMAIILRDDGGYMAIPSTGIVMRLDDKAARAHTGDANIEGVELLGEDIVNGQSTQKYRVVYADTGELTEGLLWISESGLPVRLQATPHSGSQAGETLTIELSQIVIGEQPDILFDVPTAQTMDVIAVPQTPEVVNDMVRDASDAAQDETRVNIEDKVRGGIRSLFRRK